MQKKTVNRGHQYFELIDAQRIGPYITQLQFHPKQRTGHFDFALFLRKDDAELSQRPLIQGLYSRGNISWKNQGWVDIHYADFVDFGKGALEFFSESDHWAEQVFQLIGKAIPAGGMIFVSLITDIAWEVEIELHRITRDCLSMRSLDIPPAATPIGRLLFMSGCRNIRSQAFDVQGSNRLAGEKAPNTEINKLFSHILKEQLHEYLDRPEKTEFSDLEKICRANAEYILKQF
jgi:hypothetical protein